MHLLLTRRTSSEGNTSTKRRPAQICNTHSRAMLCFCVYPFCILQYNSIGWTLRSTQTCCFAPAMNYGVKKVPEKLKVTFLKLMPIEVLFF